MYTVMIVEDEILVRIGIASSVPWMQLGAKVVAETEDGMSAWEAFEQYRPDVVIADIRIPKMNGIELLRKIRKVDQSCAVILVTNVEHAATLDEARKLGITDVLLKVSMKREDITAAVRKALDSLPESREQKPETNGSDDRWGEALMGKPVSPYGGAANEPCGCVLMHVCPSKTLSHRLKDSVIQMLEHQINSSGEDFYAVRFENEALALARKPFDLPQVETVLRNLGRYVQDHFDERLRFILSQASIHLADLRTFSQRAIEYFSAEPLFDDAILRLNADGVPYYPELVEAKNVLQHYIPMAERRHILIKCIEDIQALPGEIAKGWAEGQRCGERILAALDAKASCQGANQLVARIALGVERYCRNVRSDINPKVLQAIEYMEGHLSEKLTIQQVSEVVGYHPSYFSNLFKTELDMSYTDFLTNLRILLAQRMLREKQYSIQEVAQKCGFSDYSYFSTKFKHMVGMSPRQWRNQ